MLITNFSSGELSPRLNGRVDLPQYYQGAKELTNFEIFPTGGIERRKGFQTVATGHGQGRLISFIIDSNLSFILEIVTSGRIYIWKVDASGTNLVNVNENNKDYFTVAGYNSLPTIREIQFAQNYDELYLVQKDNPVYIIKYNTLGTLELQQFEPDFTPDIELLDDEEIITRIEKGSAKPTNATEGDYCIDGSNLYTYKNKKWELVDEDEYDEDLFSKTNKYPSTIAFFNNRLYLGATKEKKQTVWASAAPDTDGMRYNQFHTYKKYVSASKVIKDPDLHIFSAKITSKNTYSGNYYHTILSNVSQTLTLTKSVTDYFLTNFDYFPLGTQVEEINNTTHTIKVKHLTECSYDEETSDKTVVCKISLWQNAESADSGDYENKVVYNKLTTSDCSFYFELASDQNDAIKWLASAKYLSIGTESSIYCMPPTVTALSIAVEMNGRYGSDDIQALPVADAIIYFAQGKKGIREYYYSAEKEAFQTNNIALQAEHILKNSYVIDFDYATNPYPRLILTRDDGTLAIMLYDKTNGIMGWYCFSIDLGTNEKSNKILSSCVTRGTGAADIIYCIQEIEKANTTEYKIVKYDYEKEIYVDNGANLYTSKIESMPIMANTQNGKKRITNLEVRFLASYMPKVICGEKEQYFTHVTEPFSGAKTVDYAGDTERDVSFILECKNDKPCTILAINANAV